MSYAVAIDPTRYQSLGELLRDALLTFKSETAFIEMNRRKEAVRYGYLEARALGHRFARRLEDDGVGPGSRVAVLMANQPAWLLSAYAVFYRGATLVPLDFKLTPPEQEALLIHCSPRALVVDYPTWRRLLTADLPVQFVYVAGAPDGADIGSAVRWEDASAALEGAAEPTFVQAERSEIATIVYSSGTGGRPKGCMLSHDAYLEQYKALSTWYPLVVGDRYFSILPTNHAIDFMCGFVGPLCGGATVVHQRSLRPEFILDTMKQQRVTHIALVPMVLEAFDRALQKRLDEQPDWKRQVFSGLRSLNAALTRKAPSQRLSSRLLDPVHKAFGGHLKLLFCGGAFVDRDRAQRFYDMGLPVVIGYGLTEACTVITVNDLKPFRADTVGPCVPGAEVRIANPDAKGVGEVEAFSRTLMTGYLDDPDATEAAFTDDGWLRTGDLGWIDAANHLHLVGRAKNMIVTAGGKNIYPEDIEGVFDGLPCEELAVFARNYVWPKHELTGEQLLLVVRPNGTPREELLERIAKRNRTLPGFKRVGGILVWGDTFPRTASMKLKRSVLAEELRMRGDAAEVEVL